MARMSQTRAVSKEIMKLEDRLGADLGIALEHVKDDLYQHRLTYSLKVKLKHGYRELCWTWAEEEQPQGSIARPKGLIGLLDKAHDILDELEKKANRGSLLQEVENECRSKRNETS